jgi:spermidine synthase
MTPVERRETQYGTITIFRRKATGTIVYDQSGSSQSEADQAGISLASYVHALYDFLLQGNARNVLMIGCGGGTLATLLALDKCRVTVVDINADCFDLARRYFQLPPSVLCYTADGRDNILAERTRYDAIVMDAFQGSHIPAHLQTLAFLRLAAARLEHNGMWLVNTHAEHDDDTTPDRMAEAASTVWPEVRILDSPGYFNRNAIVAAGSNVKNLRLPQLRVFPSECADQVAHELDTMQFRDWRAR